VPPEKWGPTQRRRWPLPYTNPACTAIDPRSTVCTCLSVAATLLWYVVIVTKNVMDVAARKLTREEKKPFNILLTRQRLQNVK